MAKGHPAAEPFSPSTHPARRATVSSWQFPVHGSPLPARRRLEAGGWRPEGPRLALPACRFPLRAWRFPLPALRFYPSTLLRFYPSTSHESRATSHEPRATRYEIRVTRHSTTTTVLLGGPWPVRLMAMRRYSSSTLRGWAGRTALVATATAASSQSPSGRWRRQMR